MGCGMRACPIAGGFSLVQGLADTFILLGMAFDSEQAKQLNKEIFEAIYFAALRTSNELAKIDGMADLALGCSCVCDCSA